MSAASHGSSWSWGLALLANSILCIVLAAQVRISVPAPPPPSVASELAPCDAIYVERLRIAVIEAERAVIGGERDAEKHSELREQMWLAQGRHVIAAEGYRECHDRRPLAASSFLEDPERCDPADIDVLEREVRALEAMLAAMPRRERAAVRRLSRELACARDEYDIALRGYDICLARLAARTFEWPGTLY